MSERLARFRAFMASLNATDPASAVANGLYVPPPGSVAAERLAARLALQPAATLAVVGGIGSGKTTQLFVTRNLLEQRSDILPVYVDVAEEHDLAKMRAGVLTVLVGEALGRLVQTGDVRIAAAKERFREWARGYTVLVEGQPHDWDEPEPPEDYDEDAQARREYPVHVPGRVVPPRQPLNPSVQEALEPLGLLRRALVGEHLEKQSLVLLVDSLDRLSDFQVLLTTVEQDVRAITSLGIGVVMAAPLGVLFGKPRLILDRFDDFHDVLSVDLNDKEGALFLERLLRIRDSGQLLSEGALRRVLEMSGGALRGLILLARGAGEEAFLRGADTIEPAHVDVAADAFGRKLALGLRPPEEKLLKQAARGSFVPVTDDEIALVSSGRVLAFGGAPQRFALHPALVSLLAQRAA